MKEQQPGGQNEGEKKKKKKKRKKKNKDANGQQASAAGPNLVNPMKMTVNRAEL
jgi:hypothetical protein